MTTKICEFKNPWLGKCGTAITRGTRCKQHNKKCAVCNTNIGDRDCAQIGCQTIICSDARCTIAHQKAHI